MNFDLYDFLRAECPDIDAAKKFMRKWYEKWGQEIPDDPSYGYTLRAMAGHVSAALEGNTYYGFYLDSKYGSELYYAALDSDFD